MPQDTHRRGSGSAPIYLGTKKITSQQFQQVQQQINAGNRQEAVKLIRMWTGLRVEDALHITDNFFSIDFRAPQYDTGCTYLPPESHDDFSAPANSCKRTAAAKKIGKGVGLAALAGGYGIFRILSGLVKPYLGKRK